VHDTLEFSAADVFDLCVKLKALSEAGPDPGQVFQSSSYLLAILAYAVAHDLIDIEAVVAGMVAENRRKAAIRN
jgi:hypothetical protein